MSDILSRNVLAAAGVLCERIYARHPTGCCLHILLDDRNERDRDVAYCLERALQQELAEPGVHRDCVALGGLLLAMTPGQRAALRVPGKVATAAGAGHCSSCTHWQPFAPRAHDPEWEPAVANKLGLCGKVLGAEHYRKGLTLALVEDLSDNCGLRTAAGFGCVLHEAKP